VHTGNLPIFRRDLDEYTTFYAPGAVCVVCQQDAESFEARLGLDDGELDWADRLLRHARSAVEQDRRSRQEPFQPESLTLYLNNECNLRCAYCYAAPTLEPAPRLRMETVTPAAVLVAENCREKGLPFYNVFHGGGEPVFRFERLRRALAVLDGVASAHGVETFRYVATNGVLTEDQALWLARNFDLVGLSCDGPAEIQDRQRPQWDGQGSSQILERTARILREEGCTLHLRTTITSASLERQAEIAGYLCQQFAPEEIRFEPVYPGGRAGETALRSEQAGEFVTHFLVARAVAQEYGVRLLTSGSRLDSIHGPHCNVFRQTLTVVPGGVATACFKLCDASQVSEWGGEIGRLNREAGRFEINQDRLQALREQLAADPPECVACFNRFHCARVCPNRCPLRDGAAWLGNRNATFRCQVQKTLAMALLDEVAQGLWQEVEAQGLEGPYGTSIS